MISRQVFVRASGHAVANLLARRTSLVHHAHTRHAHVHAVALGGDGDEQREEQENSSGVHSWGGGGAARRFADVSKTELGV